MARLFALDWFQRVGLAGGAARCLALLGLTIYFPLTLRSDPAMQEMAPSAPAPAGAPAAPPKAPATVPKPPQVPPPPIPDTFNRYGKIWAPSDDASHPIKLNVQFPGVGEMKVPSEEELSVRDKLEHLATLSDADIRTQLSLWPPYAKMKLADEGQLLIHIQMFKEQRTKIAMDKARELGLFNSLTPAQKAKFEKEYWDKQLQMDHELAKQFEPILKARDQKLSDDLFREFSTPGAVVPPGIAAKPAPGSTPPVAQNGVH